MAKLAANGLLFHAQVLHGPDSPGDDRPKVVMVHGLSTDLASYYMTIAGSLALESDVYLYDLRGHGRSETPCDHYSVLDHVADLAALLDAWDINEPVHLYSTSFGGVVSLFFAHLYPERVASLFMIEPLATEEGWGRVLAAIISAVVQYFADPDALHEMLTEEELTEFLAWLHGEANMTEWFRRNKNLLTTTSIIADITSAACVPEEWLESIRCPVFSIYGSDSVLLEYALARDSHIPGCQPIIVPNRTHMLLAEDDLTVRHHAVDWIRERSRTCVAQHV